MRIEPDSSITKIPMATGCANVTPARPGRIAASPAGFNLPIPATARPIYIYVQGVELLAVKELWSTNAYLFAVD